MNETINNLSIQFAVAAADYLVPVMVGVFLAAVLVKMIVFYVARRQQAFSSAVETRVHRLLDGQYEDAPTKTSFHSLTDYLLKRSFREQFVMTRKGFRARKEDASINFLNNMFMIDRGAETLVEDTLKQTRYYDAFSHAPDMRKVSSFVNASNPFFTKVWGLIPVAGSNRIMAMLPTVFVISGILGTFLGITHGLPALKAIDPSDTVAAQATMGNFLESMSFAMNSSVIGILLSVVFTVLNAVFSTPAAQATSVDKLTQSLDLLWNHSHSGAAEPIIPVRIIAEAGHRRDTDPEAPRPRGASLEDDQPLVPAG